MRALIVVMLLTVGCKGANAPDKTPQEKAKPAPAQPAPTQPVEKEPPLHTKDPRIEHAKPQSAPPPAATRSNPPDVIDTEHAQIIVSDLTIKAGGAGTASIEVRPKGLWKINVEYPARVALSGAVSAVPARLIFKATDPAPSGVTATNGGLRVDIPLTGDAPGADELSAEVKFGVCSNDVCKLEKHRVGWRVDVEVE